MKQHRPTSTYVDREELAESAARLRDLLDALPPGEDSPRDAAVRRRVEGAIAATELAAGEPAPRRASEPIHDKGIQDTDV